MTFTIGHIVVTRKDPTTHKMVVDCLSGYVKLEWYDELGPQHECVGEQRCIHKDNKPTKQWLEKKEIWETARQKHHEERAVKPKRVSNPSTKRKVHFGGNHGNGGAQ
jgi:uncharacterized protein YodC (DUF2158 family)